MLEVEGEGLPAGQEEHALSPGSEYSPGPQQTEAPANELLPAERPALSSAPFPTPQTVFAMYFATSLTHCPHFNYYAHRPISGEESGRARGQAGCGGGACLQGRECTLPRLPACM